MVKTSALHAEDRSPILRGPTCVFSDRYGKPGFDGLEVNGLEF